MEGGDGHFLRPPCTPTPLILIIPSEVSTGAILISQRRSSRQGGSEPRVVPDPTEEMKGAAAKGTRSLSLPLCEMGMTQDLPLGTSGRSEVQTDLFPWGLAGCSYHHYDCSGSATPWQACEPLYLQFFL